VKISYCSQVKNRLYQFQKTFKSNLDHLITNQDIEWNIVDCASTDGLYEYLQALGPIDRFHYYKALSLDSYSIPIAKNFSARLSSGDYIFNLDIDNYIGDATSQIKEAQFGGLCCKVFKKGIYGRIGCSREIFYRVGGYDESFLPAGKQDTDLMKRCELLCYTFKHIDCRDSPILNSKIETTINMDTSLDWKTMNFLNDKKMRYNLDNNIFCPNKKFTSCQFEYNFTKIVKLSEDIPSVTDF
jgi:predicted glycosyltransferase involved in capsule biosynthesis